MHHKRTLEYGMMAVWAASLLAIHLVVQRPDIGDPSVRGFWLMAVLLLLGLGSYAALLRLPDEDMRHKLLIRLGILVRISMLLGLPMLSDDFYRYVWDGRVLLAGANPYDYQPIQWMDHLGEAASQDWAALYAHLNSKQYYSVYPPVLQGLFGLSSWISGGNVALAVTVLKAFVIMAEVGSIWLMGKLLKHLNLPRKQILLYVLNPLIVLELAGNVHTEAFMIFFLLAALWLLVNEKLWGAAAMFTLSIGAKLLPVLVFPYLWRRLPRKQFWIVTSLSVSMCILLFALFFDRVNVWHFQASLKLYFQYFEFNAGIHNWVRAIDGGVHHVFALALPWVMLAIVLWRAFTEKQPNWENLPTAILVALTLYQLHSPVLHPWYIAPLVALSVLGKYRYAILWSALIPFTYIAYFYPGIQEQAWVVNLEYVLLLGYMAYEWVFKRPGVNLSEWLLHRKWFREWVMKSIPARLRIKQARIARHLSAGVPILDIGAGHGGLCKALRADGFDVTPLDIQNLSFFPDVVPILYDGRQLPFPDKAFDTSLMITMLHHTPDPVQLITEACRVTRRRLVIMEDIYSNPIQKELTFFTDSLVNLEFEGHPHTNKTDAEWLAEFQKMGLKLVFREDFRTLLFFRQVIYVLELGE